MTDVAAAHPGPTIVPMTLVNDDYFDEITTGLRANGVQLQHFSLQAPWLGRDETWAEQQIDRCVTALASDRYARHIGTDDNGVDEVVETIARQAGLTLSKPRLPAPLRQLRRLRVGVGHIRF